MSETKRIPIRKQYTLQDLSKNWQDFILDMYNLHQRFPDPEKGVSIMCYGVEPEPEAVVTGNFSQGENAELMYLALYRMLAKNVTLIPIFVTASINSTLELGKEEKEVLFENIQKFLNMNNDNKLAIEDDSE